MLAIFKKFIFLTILSFLPLIASASLITTSFGQPSYHQDDIVTMDVYVNNVNTNMIWLDFNIEFDDSKLLFNYFDFENDVIDNSWYSDAYDFFGFAPLTVSVEFEQYWQGSLSNSFKLGTANFLALINNSAEASIGYLDVSNSYGDSVVPQTGSISVPEPTSLVICAIALLAMVIRIKSIYLIKVVNYMRR